MRKGENIFAIPTGGFEPFGSETTDALCLGARASSGPRRGREAGSAAVIASRNRRWVETISVKLPVSPRFFHHRFLAQRVMHLKEALSSLKHPAHAAVSLCQ